jgi:hypothetical protein
MSLSHDVALKKTLEDYCESRDAVRSLYAHGRKALHGAESLARETIQYGISGSSQPRDSEDEVNRSIDASYWRAALDLTKLSTIMDATAMTTFRNALGTREMPEFTIDTVQATFLEMFQNRDEMFGRGCWEVMRKIKPGRYVSNDKEVFGIPKGRIVLTFWFDSSKWTTVPRTNYSMHDTINDVDRIFRVLDGEPPNPSGFETELNQFFKEHPTDRFENEYFKVRAFANGNAHIWFRRGDLVDKLNDVIAAYCGGNALPDGTERTHHKQRPTSAYEGGVPHGSV